MYIITYIRNNVIYVQKYCFKLEEVCFLCTMNMYSSTGRGEITNIYCFFMYSALLNENALFKSRCLSRLLFVIKQHL